MATDLKALANRQNAQVSTGPVTSSGKAISSQNAFRHGLLSSRLLIEGETPIEFEILTNELIESLRPAGTVEYALVERIAVSIWRQRRLVQAEAAMINLAREARFVAQKVGKEIGRGYSDPVKPEDLRPFDPDRIMFCQKAMAELEALEEIDLKSLGAQAPTIYRQLLDDAEPETPEAFLVGHSGGLTSYIAELMLWCRKELREAEDRPHLLAIADQVRAKGIFLAEDTLELFARYQTTLDNQLYKALRALREAQEWRLKTLEAAPGTSPVVRDLADAA